ncbi:MAG: molecular chaperone HtpG [Lachnospiraceae bacterium]|nr:molecular chaperone HtpG [Lachnospiraceae bacterium]MDD4524411.1 molecular chaperone HtpG [Lachnospiraceae bacterium]
MEEKGSLSINSENMFPIIKKWLYSDHDIFAREVISNGCDAITKLNKLSVIGEAELPADYKPRIDVVVDQEEKTMTFTDNGIGMTADEVKEYINNVAFSGAADFLAKYKDKANSDQIIGHFGLGFYSTFMVSELVEIDTLSYKKDARPVHWECDGSSDFTMDEGTMSSAGTKVTLHLTDDCVEFSNYYKAKETIEKYCSFMPVEIYLQSAGTKDTETIKESERRPDDIILEELPPEKKAETSTDNKDEKKEEKPEEKRFKIKKRPELMNDIYPLWTKTPKDCTDEEYKEFYRKTFNDYKEPLFWIHLNMDYPFNLKGILYFPKINLEYESAEGVIKLYNNQVFVADNIKEVIPEFLMLLKGVIDCPDLPLNVSRSALQNDGFSKKISDYITKKVAEKLSGMCKTDRASYEKYWDDIAPFIKYGCLKDDKFCEKMTDYILFKNIDGKYVVLPDALEINKDAGKEEEEAKPVEEAKPGDEAKGDDAGKQAEPADKPEGKPEEKPQDRTIYYVTDPQQQGQYVAMFRAQKMQAFIMDHQIDQPFIQQLESKNEGIHFARVDAGVQDAMKSRTGEKAAEDLKKQEDEITKVIRKALKKDKLKISLTKLKDKKVSSILTVDEQNRRMSDMMKMYAMNGMPTGMDDYAKEGETLVLNANHPLVQYVLNHQSGSNTKMICEQLYDLAELQNAPLSPDAMSKFVVRTNDIMVMLAKDTKAETTDDATDDQKKEQQ